MTIMNYSHQRGLTLIELMVALVISLLILAGLFTVYQSNQRGYRLNDGLVRTQESGRFAIDFLTRDIRQAAYPHAVPNPNEAITSPAFQTFLFDDGSNNVNVINTIPGAFSLSDTLALRHGIENLQTTDCNGLMPDPNNAGGGNADTNVDTEGWTTLNIYDIRATGRLNNRGNPILALFCNGNELVEGIENMQVLYGVDTDPDSSARDFVANQYFTFDNVPSLDGDAIPDWNRVVSLRIALLASSVDERSNAPSPRTFNLLDLNIPAFNDQKIRRVYTTTVLIRNNMAQ